MSSAGIGLILGAKGEFVLRASGDLDVVELAFHETGEGPALLFLPGLGGDRRAFTGAARHFARRFRAVVVDLRDAGQSPRVAHSYTLAEMADDVAALLEKLNIAAGHVVGHSLGGMVAQELALRHPTRVASLVLASTHAGADTWRRALVESWIAMRRLMGPGDFTRATLPWLVAPAFYDRSSSQAEGLARFAESNQHPQDPAAFERQARASLGHDTRGRLMQMTQPTLVVSGAEDIVNRPAAARELATGLARGKLVLLDGVGHLPHVESPEIFAQTIENFFAS